MDYPCRQCCTRRLRLLGPIRYQRGTVLKRGEKISNWIKSGSMTEALFRFGFLFTHPESSLGIPTHLSAALSLTPPPPMRAIPILSSASASASPTSYSHYSHESDCAFAHTADLSHSDHYHHHHLLLLLLLPPPSLSLPPFRTRFCNPAPMRGPNTRQKHTAAQSSRRETYVKKHQSHGAGRGGGAVGCRAKWNRLRKKRGEGSQASNRK